MKKILTLLLILLNTGLLFSQIKIWERSAAAANYPAYLGTGNTERGFTTGTLVLNPFSRIWEKSSALGSFPSFLGTGNTERGFAFGTVGTNERIFLVDRKITNFVYVLNATTGDSVGRLDTTGFALMSSGTLRINDAEVSADGMIYACNLSVGSGADTLFKVYKWATESSAPQVVINYTTKIRLGDKFTVTGSTADNSIVIWAAAASQNKIVKFTTTNNGASFTATEIILTGSANGSSPSVFPNNTATELYVKSNGGNLKRYQANGTLVDSIPTTVIGTGSNALRYFESFGKKYVAVYTYGAGNELLRIADITGGLSSAVFIGASPSMGSVANANGTGDIAMKIGPNNAITLYILGTNVGIGAYACNPVYTGAIEKMYIVSRKISNFVYSLNVTNGDSVSRLDTTGFALMSSGTLRINDVEMSSDGVVFASNLAVGTASDTTFKVYRWSNEGSAPQLAVNYITKVRLGDKFTATGSMKDNSLVIWAAAASQNKIIKFTTTDNGNTFTASEIVLSGSANGSSPSVVPNTNASELYVKGGGVNLKRYLANGTLVDSLPTTVIGTGSNALRYFELAGKKYLAVYTFGVGNENARIVDVTGGLLTATLTGTTPSLGSVANANGTGDISLRLNGDGTVNLHVFGTNNGIGVYKFAPPTNVATPDFIPPQGLYTSAVWMKITVNTPGAKIYYTLNGATPDSVAGKLFVDSLKISDSTTVKAIAYAPGMLPSAVATARYNILIFTAPSASPAFPLWAKTQAAGTFPASFSISNYERGMAYGKVGGKDRVYVVTRNGGPKIIVFDALKGDSVGVMPQTPNITGGTFPLNFVDVSDDGIIFSSNMTQDPVTDPFKIYRWNAEKETAAVAIELKDASLASVRLGDLFSVTGKASDNSLVMFAAGYQKDKIVKFTTTDNGKTFIFKVITLANGAMGTMPNVAVAADSTLFVKSYGRPLYRFKADGTLKDSILSSVIGTDVTHIKYFRKGGKDYVICYYPNDAGFTDERFTIVDVTSSLYAYPVYTSPSIGTKANLNGTGAVDYLMVDSTNCLFFMLGTNNGLAAFANNANYVVKTLDTLFYGTSKNILANPYGWGYIAGSNSYADLGKYQRFDLKKNDMLAGFRFYFGVKKIAGTPDTVTLVIKTVRTSNGAPDSTIASTMILADKIDTSVAGNTFILDNPVKVTGPVFIGFEFTKSANDTIALVSDKDGEGGGANRVWEKFEDGVYNDFKGVLAPTYSWNIDVDLWVAAYYKKGALTSVDEKTVVIPGQYSLEQNYPNPFNPSTTIRYAIPSGGKVGLRVYNVLGQQIAELVNGQMAAGTYAVQFNASSFATGVYFYRLEVKGNDGTEFAGVKKLLLLK